MQRRFRAASLSTLLILSTSVSTSSCRFQSRPFGWIEPGAGSMSMGCLDGALDTLTHFTQGKASAREANDVFSCLDFSLVMFTQMITGNDPGSYSVSELRNLLQGFFLRQFKITDTIFEEMLRLKQAFLGGTADQISARDLKRIRDLLAMLGRHAGRMAQDQPLTPENVSTWTPERMDGALERVYESSQELAQWVESASGSYSFSEFESLLRRFEETGAFAGTDSGKLIEDIRRWMPFIRLAKSYLIEGTADELRAKDWGTLIRLGARGYMIALRMNNFASHATTWTLGDDRARLVGLARNFLGVLNISIETRSSHAITEADLSQAIDLLPAQLPIKKKILMGLLPTLLDRLFGNPQSVLNGTLPGVQFDRARVKRITDDFETWAQTQEALERRYVGERAVVDSPRAYEAPLRRIADEVTQEALLQLDEPTEGPDFLFQGGETPSLRLHLSGWNSVGKTTVWERTVRNWTRSLARIVIRGYTPRNSQWRERKIGFTDLYRLFLDIKPALAEANMLDSGIPLNLPTLDELYHLTDLVNFTSDGDGVIDERELGEQITVLLSSAAMGADAEAFAKLDCPVPTARCVKQSFADHFESIFASFPDLLVDWRSWSEQDRKKTIEYAQFLSLKRDKSDDELYVPGEYVAMGTGFHQLELVFARFDISKNDRIITESEAMRAFPLFKVLLRKMVVEQGGAIGGLVDGHLLESLFSHLVAKDEDPQKDIPSLLFWNFFPETRKAFTKVVRKDLVRRFAKLRRNNPPKF